MNKKNIKGFSLIEIVIAMAIMVILISIAILIGRSFNNTENLENAGKIIEEKVKLAKARSLGALNDTNYGVHFENNRIIIFAGSAYADGTPTNQVFNLPDNIDINAVSLAGGGQDMVFGRLTGTTANYGSIGFRVTNDASKSRQMTVNEEGQVSFGTFKTSAGSAVVNARHIHFNLGWNIQNETNMKLEWVDAIGGVIASSNVSLAPYFNADKSKLDWEGTTVVGSVNQKIRIHSWLDGSLNTVLCVMRGGTEYEKLNIYFDGYLKEIATYENVSGAVVATKKADVLGTMEIQ